MTESINANNPECDYSDYSKEELAQMGEQEDYVDLDVMQERIRASITLSPVVARCKQDDCGKEIKQAEINMGMADKDTCSDCVLAYVADMVG